MGEVARDVDRGRRQRRGQDEADRPEQAPPAIVTISTASGWMPSVAPNAIGWIICCSAPLASSTIDGHRDRGARALRPEREQHREGAGRPRAEVRHVRGEEVHEHDRADLGTPSTSAPSPITIALKAATAVTPAK